MAIFWNFTICGTQKYSIVFTEFPGLYITFTGFPGLYGNMT